MDTTHDTSFNNPHDKSNYTYPSSYTDWGIRGHHNASLATHSVISVPACRVVEIDSSPQMFPSCPTTSLVTSVIFTFICCFACSIPAIIVSKQAVDNERAGYERVAASRANSIAFWLILSFTAGVVCWSTICIFLYAYRFNK